ncbi:basic salivary proline-rich protein 4-like [Myiozetetes cayanensis]|uniref:basic salivary proline-rich protein 4-like n=1 Tax=Myiozetetes cayanensis TaxID=478635 RepID=UPI00215DFAF6|nr:basic salivary proline-rich protein 4-like [Myiozetetes cayanensis]
MGITPPDRQSSSFMVGTKTFKPHRRLALLAAGTHGHNPDQGDDALEGLPAPVATTTHDQALPDEETVGEPRVPSDARFQTPTLPALLGPRPSTEQHRQRAHEPRMARLALAMAPVCESAADSGGRPSRNPALRHSQRQRGRSDLTGRPAAVAPTPVQKEGRGEAPPPCPPPWSPQGLPHVLFGSWSARAAAGHAGRLAPPSSARSAGPRLRAEEGGEHKKGPGAHCRRPARKRAVPSPSPSGNRLSRGKAARPQTVPTVPPTLTQSTAEDRAPPPRPGPSSGLSGGSREKPARGLHRQGPAAGRPQHCPPHTGSGLGPVTKKDEAPPPRRRRPVLASPPGSRQPPPARAGRWRAPACPWAGPSPALARSLASSCLPLELSISASGRPGRTDPEPRGSNTLCLSRLPLVGCRTPPRPRESTRLASPRSRRGETVLTEPALLGNPCPYDPLHDFRGRPREQVYPEKARQQPKSRRSRVDLLAR